jgi:hypothetical protein
VGSMNANSLRKQGIGLSIGLCIEFLLGMLTNLFVSFPDASQPKQHWEFARTQILLVSHILIGILLMVGAIVLVIRAYKLNNRVWKIASWLGLGSIILAIATGSEFVSSQSDVLSLGMAIFFLTALISYGWGIYQTKS